MSNKKPAPRPRPPNGPSTTGEPSGKKRGNNQPQGQAGPRKAKP